MSADLHIHIAKDIPIGEIQQYAKSFISESDPNGPGWIHKDKEGNVLVYDEDSIHQTPNIWIGEVSWLKAGLLEDEESFIPETVKRVAEIVGDELPIVDDTFIQKIRDAFDLPNSTKKPGGVMGGEGYALAKVEDVVKFLEEHRGERAFQISW